MDQQMLAMATPSVAPIDRSGLNLFEKMQINSYSMRFNSATLALHRRRVGFDPSEGDRQALAGLADIFTAAADNVDFFESMGKKGRL